MCLDWICLVRHCLVYLFSILLLCGWLVVVLRFDDGWVLVAGLLAFV